MQGMPVDLLVNIAADVPRGRALLGMDVGKKTIGLAVCDPGHSVATPLTTIRRTKLSQDVIALEKIIKDYDIGGYVIGLPVNMDGSEGPRAQSVQDFALELFNYPDIFGLDPWIALWDERLSTASVKGFVDNMVEKRKTRVNSKDSGLIDKLAAQHILQGALEAI